MAHPGSLLYKDAVAKRLPLPENSDGLDWIRYSQHAY